MSNIIKFDFMDIPTQISEIMESDKPIEKRVDILGSAVRGLSDDIDRLKSYKEEVSKAIDGQINLQTKNLEKVKIEGARYFKENGIDKVNGIITSSITLTKEQEAGTELKDVSLTNSEMKNLLKANGLPTTKLKDVEIKEKKSMLKINKRR